MKRHLNSMRQIALILIFLCSFGFAQAEEKNKTGSKQGKSAETEKNWKPLFDGKSLKGWEITDFAGHGDVRVEDGRIILDAGLALTGITWTNPLPKRNYEVALEAMKVDGSDFFCGLTVPVEDSHCSLIVGGWGGSIVGVSSIDGLDASENESTHFMRFEPKRWYAIRFRITPKKLEAWIDQEKVVSQEITGRKVSMRPGEIELSRPFGLASWQTTAAFRNVRIRELPEDGKTAGK